MVISFFLNQIDFDRTKKPEGVRNSILGASKSLNFEMQSRGLKYGVSHILVSELGFKI